MSNKVTLARYKNCDYIVNYENKKYVWAGARGTMISKKEVPQELVDWLMSFTSTFKNGDLTVVDNEEVLSEIENNMVDVEEFKANGMSKEEITTLLKGNLKKMEAELNKITADSTKRFVLEVAKEIGLENSTKQRFIKEWLGSQMSIEDLFYDGE